jgi:hypothetical protein
MRRDSGLRSAAHACSHVCSAARTQHAQHQPMHTSTLRWVCLPASRALGGKRMRLARAHSNPSCMRRSWMSTSISLKSSSRDINVISALNFTTLPSACNPLSTLSHAHIYLAARSMLLPPGCTLRRLGRSVKSCLILASLEATSHEVLKS